MRKLTFGEIVAIGIGGMIGGGIFAVLGLSIQLSGKYAPYSFLFGGIIALLTAYSYHKFSLKIKSEGGTISFINFAFGDNLFTRWINIILWVSYLIMLSLYSYAFGSYFNALFNLHGFFWYHFSITLPMIIFFIINFLGSKAVGNSEKYIVAFKVLILLIFIIFGLFTFRNTIQPSKDITHIISGGMIIFLAYEGFELIANAAKDAKSEKSLSLAFYVSVISVILIYFLISFITVNTLNYSQIIHARDYVLAEAAKPFLGYIGFVFVSIAAIFSTSSAINATLYGSSRVSYTLMKLNELPRFSDWKNNKEGLFIITGLVILFSNIFNLSSISLIGSAGFLIIFSIVNFAAFYKRKYLNANGIITLISGSISLISFFVLLFEIIPINPIGFITFISILLSSLVLEFLLEKFVHPHYSRYS